MASKSKGVSRGAKVSALIGALATVSVPAVSAADLIHHFHSKGVVYEAKNGIVTPVNSPDYPIYLKNGIAFADINGNAEMDAYDFRLPTGTDSVTDELIKTRDFWKSKNARGISELGYFTYFSAYHNQRNLFSVGSDGVLSMGPHQFIFNQEGTALVYDTPLPNFPYGNGIADSKDLPMGSRFNSVVIPQLREITKLAKETGDAQRRLSEAEGQENASAEIIAGLEAQVAYLQGQMNHSNGNGITMAVNGHSISREEYDAKVEELETIKEDYRSLQATTNDEKHNYEIKVQILNSDIKTLQATLATSQGKVGELEEIVSTVRNDLTESQESLESTKLEFQNYMGKYPLAAPSTSHIPTPAEIEASVQEKTEIGTPRTSQSDEAKLQELANREVIPIQRGSYEGSHPEDRFVATPEGVVVRDTPAPTEATGTAKTEKTVEDLYLERTNSTPFTEGSEGDFNAGAKVSGIYYQTPARVDSEEDVHHRATAQNAEERYVPTPKKELSGKVPLSFTSAVSFSGNQNSIGLSAGVRLGYEENLLNGAFTVGYQKGISDETINTTATEQDPVSPAGLYGVRTTNTTTQNTDFSALELALSGYLGNEKAKAVFKLMYKHEFYDWNSVENKTSTVWDGDVMGNQNSFATSSSGNGHDNLFGVSTGIDFKIGSVRPEVTVGAVYSVNSNQVYPHFAAGLTIAQPSKY